MQPDHHIKTMNNRGRIMSLCAFIWRNIAPLPAILPYQITKITAKAMKTSEIHACAPRRFDSLTDDIEYIFHRRDKRI